MYSIHVHVVVDDANFNDTVAGNSDDKCVALASHTRRGKHAWQNLPNLLKQGDLPG